jgi:hypothetical protein
VEPWEAESREQNEVVMTAVADTASGALQRLRGGVGQELRQRHEYSSSLKPENVNVSSTSAPSVATTRMMRGKGERVLPAGRRQLLHDARIDEQRIVAGSRLLGERDGVAGAVGEVI